MTNLIPEVRVNKNGVPVTKHVKPDAAQGTRGAIPSPVLPAKSKKPAFKIWPSQQEPRYEALDRTTFRPSAEILKALPFPQRGLNYNYRISDEAAYGMFSTMRVNDAIHMIHFGITTKDDALDFMRSHGLESLMQDNSAMMQEAFERRIRALALVTLHGKYGMGGHQKGAFLDAAEVQTSGTLRSLDGPDPMNATSLKVLAGDISLADIKTVGISRIQKSNAAQSVLNALQLIKNGSLDCTADHVRALIDKNNKDNSVSTPLQWALQSINAYGADFLVNVDRLMTASNMAAMYGGKGVPVNEIKELITYEGIMRKSGRSASGPHLKQLWAAGVDPVMAGKHYDGPESVARIIGAKKNNVPTAVSEGWL